MKLVKSVACLRMACVTLKYTASQGGETILHRALQAVRTLDVSLKYCWRVLKNIFEGQIAKWLSGRQSREYNMKNIVKLVT